MDDVNDDVRVAFGDAPGNSLPLPTVEAVLRLWHERAPEVMGAFVAEAMFGVPPKPPARRTARL